MKNPREARRLDAPYGQCAKRLSITEAAEAVFARDGFAATSLDTIACTAGVSRQTIYNHYGDKENLFVAVVRDLTERSNAGLLELVASFPDRPGDLEADLTEFALRLIRTCLCNRDGIALRRLIEAEGERYPELFEAWREHGPGKSWALIGARLARLDHAGLLRIEDPDLAARQFVALAQADIQMITCLGGRPTEAELRTAAGNAVRTFLRAFGQPSRPERAAPGQSGQTAR